jgi:hypothetical protein
MKTKIQTLYSQFKAAKSRSDAAVAEGRRMTGWY